ncbi:peptidylprolyl isomerase [Nocardioides sp. zg-1308]|uniref:Peptidyl-prolyl cis-trans isomerase n=1 Tax=Nocardioides renjunii TaxID=3095075 RepID=A0ABU5KCG6_9ACTN|nr:MULTISPECIES: peptidylprolyl isomerase [unclassified Nocardioides]MDZ5662110.1 peptidylprolyl isomerase [Nocardioides sp. S-58]NPD06181.1 peptidylprolyl isomerase [Nocardioides sp. zg-1308]WQQ24349.1 peptidylprolyl isomerase [Nocardioides sp. S-34]
MLKRLAAVATCLSVLALAGCGTENDVADDVAEDTSSASPSESESPEASETAAGETATCDYPADGQQPAREVEAPDTEAQAEGTVAATITTNFGDIGLTLDAAAAPCTVNSFVSLAEQGFYDDTPCPRIGDQEGFGILQCGDPTGTGSGGAGYSFADELTGDETYPAGTLAMANAGPNTNGSQFFLVFLDSQFPPSYTVFGTIDEAGIGVIEDIAAEGNDASSPAGGGAPNKDVTIEKVTVG